MTSPATKGPRQRQADEQLEQSLYAKREKIYPREVHGLYARLRTAGVLGLLGIFYLTPWLRWNGHQAVLLDLPARKFHIFGLTLWPQDFIYLAFLLIIAGLALFFFTALAGRIWCGYACPQTVWTEAFLWMERRVEGDRMHQQKLDAMPINAKKLRIKATKHALWILFSIWTGFTFVGYFAPIIELGQRLTQFSLGPWESFWVVFYGFATYGNAGWMREQVCLYMCPYARFQSAMFDKDTLIISYLPERGEPRGSRRRSADSRELGLGDCIDCTLCVQVCPTGIDIRNGLQYECIACSACIDACDDVMDKMEYARGLIKYTTQHEMTGGKTRILRPRIVVYAVFLLVIMGIFAYSIETRTALGLDVIRDRNRLYRETDEGLIENVYILKILNMDEVAHRYTLSVAGIPGLELRTDMKEIEVMAGDVMELPVRLRADEAQLTARSNKVVFELVASDKPELSVQEEARFLGPR
ncbi:MAG: cytochrome c oxidase accessory protein CcoG [Gammaproteobacteria bacterium]|nr:cytochrome c oxidase accessory protein CcoG [Gammaproteobacteria bacterium]MDH3560871.1 cytochrome c oxidase accessory protein CcoG [Gammaproteobacteria bacterium]